jgi:Protein kinase domain
VWSSSRAGLYVYKPMYMRSTWSVFMLRFERRAVYERARSTASESDRRPVLALDTDGARIPAGLYRLFFERPDWDVNAHRGDGFELVSVDDPAAPWPKVPPQVIRLLGLGLDDLVELKRFYGAISVPPASHEEAVTLESVLGTSLASHEDLVSYFLWASGYRRPHDAHTRVGGPYFEGKTSPARRSPYVTKSEPIMHAVVGDSEPDDRMARYRRGNDERVYMAATIADGILSVMTSPAVRITICNGSGSQLASDEGSIVCRLAPGLYRARFEHGAAVSERLIDHSHESYIDDRGPPYCTPFPYMKAGTVRDPLVSCAKAFSTSTVETCPPLGEPLFESRLFVFLHQRDRRNHAALLPSEPMAILDLDGRRLAMLDMTTCHFDRDLGFVVLAARVEPGTYRLRAMRSCRDLAITVPRNRAAHVFLEQLGRVALEEARVSLVPIEEPYNPVNHEAMECAVAALRTRRRDVPRMLRTLPWSVIDADICLGLAVAHLARRAGDWFLFVRVWRRVRGYVELADVTILDGVAMHEIAQLPPADRHGLLSYMFDQNTSSAPVNGSRSIPHIQAERPPLFHASALLALTHPAHEQFNPHGAFEQASCTPYQDSIWCTWSARAWDERWIEPTVEAMRERHPGHSTRSIARRLRIPASTVERTVHNLERTLPRVNGATVPPQQVQVPGYRSGDVLGRGAHGVVLRATRDSDGIAVALKIVPLQRCEQRAQIVRDLGRVRPWRHRRLLSFTSHGVLAGESSLWLEMELCRESALDQVTVLDEPLQIEQACKMAFEAMEGLEILHASGNVHGNIKPGNLMHRLDGSLALSEAGLAAALYGDADPPQEVLDSTAPFMPAELLTDGLRPLGGGGVNGSPPSDVWSLAATLYFLLTLELPRERFTRQSPLDAALHNPCVPIRERRPELQERLAAWIDRALAREIGERPRDAKALRGELVAALGSG